MEKTSEEMCILTSMKKAELIFSYMLNGERHSSMVYDKIIFSDVRPITITITEENNTLLFDLKHKSND